MMVFIQSHQVVRLYVNDDNCNGQRFGLVDAGLLNRVNFEKTIFFVTAYFVVEFSSYYFCQCAQRLNQNTAVPLTPHRHAGLDPVSSKLLKPLDSGLRRNDGEMLSTFMSPTPLGILRPKHYAKYSKTKSS